MPSGNGGSGNPPDKYALVQLTGNQANDLAAINAAADEGYRFEANLPFNYVLMSGYTKQD
jgi:hypothetical protein